MKRFLLLTLAAALLAVLLTGCAGSRSAYSYRGNVSTTDNGRVNGTNDNMNGIFEGTDGMWNYGTELPADAREDDRDWENGSGRRDSTVDPNRSGWTSGSGEDAAWDTGANSGRAIPRSGVKPRVK